MDIPPPRPGLPSPPPVLVAALLLAALFLLVQFGLLRLAFERLGLDAGSTFLLVAASLFGSLLDIPVLRLRVPRQSPSPVPWMYRGLLRTPPAAGGDTTTIAVNIGGCVIPVGFAIHLIGAVPLDPALLTLATACIAALGFALSRPIPGVGIGMPLLVPPLASALLAMFLDPTHAPALAYASGTLGVLLGADVLKLSHVARLGAPMLSIGGAGTFDGIFLTGVLAVLLA